MYDDVITLIGGKKGTNDYGDIVGEEEQKRQAFVSVESVTQTEFYQAQAVGLKAEIKFILPDYLEYQGEEKVLYTPFCGQEEAYTVIRTFRRRNGNELEIVCEKGIEHAGT